MSKVTCLGFTFLAVFLITLSTTSALEATFQGAGTQQVMVSITAPQITDIQFQVTGLSVDDVFPSSVSIDIGSDSIVDWEFDPFHSILPLKTDSVLFASSTVSQGHAIYFADLKQNLQINDITGLGKLTSNVFQQIEENEDSTLGITSVEDIANQIIAITTDAGVTHAFVPAIDSEGTIGLYVAQGGSTYYCNTDHSFLFTSECNLSPTQALQPAHLARSATPVPFNYMENFTSSALVQRINNRLQACSAFPCSIPVTISSATKGKIQLDYAVRDATLPLPQISLQQNGDAYTLSVNTNALQNVTYFYGVMPHVYVIPVVAGDDTLVLTDRQKERLLMLNNTLAQSWDRLTDNKHPLDFTFYLTPQKLTNFRAYHDLSRFEYELWNVLIPSLQLEHPSIIIALDIRDYFPQKDPVTTKRTSEGIISEIYVNGFSDTPKTLLTGYDEEILRNIVLHELMHSFIEYPPATEENLFYSNHPASFSSLSSFDTYTPTQSPTGVQGYFEPFSIMNQLRIYMPASAIQNRNVEISDLDKVLLGTLSQYSAGSYTFYEGSISSQNGGYVASSLAASKQYNAAQLYANSNDKLWWDVRSVSKKRQLPVSATNTLSKAEQANRALWVYVTDANTQEYFKVFNANAKSIQHIVGSIPTISVTGAVSGVSGTTTTTSSSRSSSSSSSNRDSVSNPTFYSSWRDIFTYRDSELSSFGSISPTVHEDERIVFKVNGKNYNLNIVSLSATQLTASILSTTFSLSQGQTYAFKLDEDESPDVSITVDSLSAESAKITLTSLTASEEDTSKVVLKNTAQTQQPLKFAYLLWVLPLLLAILLIIYLFIPQVQNAE